MARKNAQQPHVLLREDIRFLRRELTPGSRRKGTLNHLTPAQIHALALRVAGEIRFDLAEDRGRCVSL